MANYSGTYAGKRLDLAMSLWEHASQMPDFIGLKVLPVFEVMEKAASYSVVTRETILQVAETRRGPSGDYNRINFGAKDKSFDCKEHGLEITVFDDKRRLYRSDFDAESTSLEIVKETLMRALEQRIRDAVYNTTTFTGAAYFTDRQAAPWSTASSDWITHVIEGAEKVRQNSGMAANALIIGPETLSNLLKNTKTRDQYKGAVVITIDMILRDLRALVGLEYLLVGKARKNTAKEGQTFSGADIWDKKYAMVARIKPPGQAGSILVDSLGSSKLWVEDSPVPLVVEMYREEQRRSDVFRVRHNVDDDGVEKDFGHLLQVEA